MIQLVTKRDGTEVLFDSNKIKRAIQLAFLKTKNNYNHEGIKITFDRVMEKLEDFENVHVEKIQDIIVETLTDVEPEVAKNFQNYRVIREKNRDELFDKKMLSKIEYIENYKKASNAATGSKYDANANVEHKNIATMSGELNKYENIQLNRKILMNKITEMWGKEVAKEYLRQLQEHEIYAHDETSLKPYCVSINMYPFLFDGLRNLGGTTTAPQNLSSFIGSFINLVFAVASQFAGAVATVEFLMYMDYFIRKEWGDDYYNKMDEIIALGNRPRTIAQRIDDYFAQVVYSINQPAAARDYQSVFWNISIFDKFYFDSLFSDFRFPDGEAPTWESLDWLQRRFMKWFNKEREKEVLTFPVVTMAMLTEDDQPKDKSYADFVAGELSEGNSFFIYMSDSADSLASCCRLRNEIQDNTFSYSLGAGGVSTGSVNVITINLNRLVQDGRDIREEVKKVHKYQLAYRAIIKDFLDSGLLPVYDAGFIALEKQFLTIGVNGMVEAAESQGIAAKPTPEYHAFVDKLLKPIYEENKNIRAETGVMFNTEFVPAENLGVKNANWDHNDGYIVTRDVYNSYFYAPEDKSLNIVDKFVLHGKEFVRFLDGGSANHVNLDEHASKAQYLILLNTAAKLGTNYWTINVRNTVCNHCGYVDKNTHDSCRKCGSEDVDYATRIIGYLKRVSKFSEARQKEESIRAYKHY